tara:strand:+ start:810 stop:1184 length:375 start_codon:yes stop_codon:yes gene_type:complete
MPKKRASIIAKENNLEMDYLLELVKSKLPEEAVTGTGYAIWINEEGQEILVKAIDTPELTPKLYRGTVHSNAPNRSYIYVYIKEIQKKVPVVIPRKLEGHLTAGKNVKVEAIVDDKGTSYRYVR